MTSEQELRQTAAALRARRARAAGEWGLTRGTVLVASGLPIAIAGTDQYHDFHAHNEHRYLGGTDVAGSVLAFDPGEGWTLFAPVATVEERVWVGDGVQLEELAAASGVERVRASAELAGWLERRRGEPLVLLGNDDVRRQPGGYGVEGWAALEMEPDEELSGRLSEQVAVLRRAKDGDELALMREAARISEVGHRTALRLARPGLTERQIQVELEAAFFREGSERTAYGSIVGTGANGAVLHFSPTKRVVRDGEIILIDAGAEYAGYASDVTRTFPAGMRFSGVQRELYELVLGVQEAAIADVRPGKEYRELHLEASRRIAAGLVDAGILRGDPDGLVEQDAHALFFPHGLGHMLGLATHDAGGCLAGRTPSDRFGMKYLRADLPLEAGYVVTVEPGIYFIRALLEDRERRERYHDAVNWERVDGLLDFGGIRIEDDVLVTEQGAEVLSGGLPKDTKTIEELRREALEA